MPRSSSRHEARMEQVDDDRRPTIRDQPAAGRKEEPARAASAPAAASAAAKALQPLKLTLKLGKAVPASTEDLRGEAKDKTRVTPKLTLSIRKPSTDHGPVPASAGNHTARTPGSTGARTQVGGGAPLPPIEEAPDGPGPTEGPKKRGRKKGSRLAKAYSAEAAGEQATGRPGRRPKGLVQSAPASLLSSADSIRLSKSASDGHVAPAAAPPAPPVLKPVYSEEDRQIRQTIAEVLQSKVAGLQSHRPLWGKPVCSAHDLIRALWPFYEQLAVAEISHSALFRQAGLEPPRRAVWEEKLAAETDALTQRFNALCVREKAKARPTELVLLEHRLCLEEEKYLYTRLKSDYYGQAQKPAPPPATLQSQHQRHRQEK